MLRILASINKIWYKLFSFSFVAETIPSESWYIVQPTSHLQQTSLSSVCKSTYWTKVLTSLENLRLCIKAWSTGLARYLRFYQTILLSSPWLHMTTGHKILPYKRDSSLTKKTEKSFNGGTAILGNQGLTVYILPTTDMKFPKWKRKKTKFLGHRHATMNISPLRLLLPQELV